MDPHSRAVEMRCYRKTVHISYKDQVTNEEVRAKIQQAIGPYEDLLTMVKIRKTAVAWSSLMFIRSGQNHLARHSERGKKTRQTEEDVGRQHQGMDRPGVRQVPEGSGKQGKMEKYGCKIICGAPTTLTVKGFMRMRTVIIPLTIVYTQNSPDNLLYALVYPFCYNYTLTLTLNSSLQELIYPPSYNFAFTL